MMPDRNRGRVVAAAYVVVVVAVVVEVIDCDYCG
jgi:hypothetical protein